VIATSLPSGNVTSTALRLFSRAPRTVSASPFPHQVDVGLRPDRVVRQAATEDGRQHGAVAFYLLDQRLERAAELLLDRFVLNRTPFEDTPSAAGPGKRVDVA
jgi:hypothetical protein